MFIDKESANLIEKLNEILGMSHRSKPYDFNSAVDLKQALFLTVSAYRDYQNYCDVLLELTENFDESLENYDTATWFHLYSPTPEKADELASECVTALDKTTSLFSKITDRAKMILVTIIKAALSAPKDKQTAVFGRYYEIKPEDFDTEIKGLFELLDDTPYNYPMEDNLKALLEVMEEMWAANSS